MPCGSPQEHVVKDYATDHGSAREYLQRIGVLETLPTKPLASFANMRVHRIPLQPPLPLPDLLPQDGNPDHGQTLEWPHPDLTNVDDD